MKKDLLAFCKRVVERLYNHEESKGLLGKYTSFLVKFLFFSTLLYLLWIPFASAYFSAILKITVAYFELIEMDISAYLEIIGTDISLNPTPKFVKFAYSQGVRSCIPPFIALILATNLSLTPFLEKKSFSAVLKGLIIGIPILFFFRVILQISLIYFAYFQIYSTFVIFLSGTCRVALPFLLWLALTYKQIFPLLKPEKYVKVKRGGDKKGYICPFCGAEKVGILDHIRNVHGEEALKSEEVKQLLEQNSQIKN